jgi:FlaA1/EpsC-like NDP-sugar epimerase
MFLIQRLEFHIRSFNLISLKTIQILLDLIILWLAFALAYLLRFDFSPNLEITQTALTQVLFVVPLQILFLRYFRVHKFIWRYISLPEAKQIIVALLLAAIPLLLLRFFLPVTMNLGAVPLSITILDFCLAAIGILGIRMLRRELHEFLRRSNNGSGTSKKKAVLLIGAGRAGVLTITEIKSRGDLDFEVKGFIDDNKLKLRPATCAISTNRKAPTLSAISRKRCQSTIRE